MPTTVRFPKHGAFGRDRGGIPVVIEKPNRALRRLQAKQQKQRAASLPPSTNLKSVASPVNLSTTYPQDAF